MGVREFYGGDIKGIMSKLDYLEDLGMEMPEEDILNMFTKLQLVNYREQKPNALLVIAL